MKDDNLKYLEKVLKAFANRRRLFILRYLNSVKEASVGDIASEINLSVKATSKHLNILLAIDILEKDQKSLQMFYRVSSDKNPAVEYLLSTL